MNPPPRKLRIVVVNTLVLPDDEGDAALAAQAQRGADLRIAILPCSACSCLSAASRRRIIAAISSTTDGVTCVL